MRLKLIPGPRNERFIKLVRSTLQCCQEKDDAKSSGPCLRCENSTKYDCKIMQLCRKYGFDRIYDAVFYAFGGDKRIINDIEDFDWETMTEEEYSMYLNWLSKGNIMQSWFQIPTSMCSE